MSYKPVKGYCVLYPEEIKKLASEGTGKRSPYASAPCFAIYLALRQRAWNTKTNWWKTFVSYETLALDLGWEWNPSTKKSIERSLLDLQDMGMILYTKGSKATVSKDGRANEYSLVFYKCIRQQREERSNETPVSSEKDTSVQEKDMGVQKHSKIGDMGVAPKNNSFKKHSIFTNERQSELDSLFEAMKTSEKTSEEEAFRDFMGDWNPSETENCIYNNNTSEWMPLETIQTQLAECKWDWSFLLQDYDVEDIDNKLIRMLPKTMQALKMQIQTVVTSIRWGATTKEKEISKIKKATK